MNRLGETPLEGGVGLFVAGRHVLVVGPKRCDDSIETTRNLATLELSLFDLLFCVADRLAQLFEPVER